MNISVQWLKEWVDVNVSIETLINDLTMGGIEVDYRRTIAALDKVVIGEVLSCEKLTNSVHLKVCQVNINEQKPLSIVCGAPNVQKSAKVVVATRGAKLSNEVEIAQQTIQSVISQGMLCSEAEIGLSDEHSKIIILPDDAPVGSSINDYLALNDDVLSLDITPNRGDCFSVAGIARELSAYYKLPINTPNLKPIKAVVNDTLPSEVQLAEACPRYLTRVIKNVNNTLKTPQWLANKLIKAGHSLNSPIVDITNYVMLELGQPLHAFDLTEIDQKLIVRQSNNERLLLLNNKEVSLDDDTLVIADNSKVLGIAGVMGALAGSVTINTKDIVLEAAFFTPHLLAGCARKYGLHTDASLRFERGVDFNLAEQALTRATALIVEISGGKVGNINHTEHKEYLPKQAEITLTKKEITATLGIDLDSQWISLVLEQLGFDVKQNNTECWLIKAPSYRFDITRAEDLIEEIARLYGYDKLPSAQLKPSDNRCQNRFNNKDNIHHKLINKGYQELINYSFIDKEIANKINDKQQLIELKNPISQEMSVMRQSLWQGLLLAVKKNASHSHYNCRFFETGLCFYGVEENQQIKKIAAVITGQKYQANWRYAENNSVDFYDIKEPVEELLLLTDKSYHFEAAEQPMLQTGQSAAVFLDNENIGYVGKLSPRIARALDLNNCYLFELNFAPLINKITPVYKAFSNHQLSLRDLAVLVDKDITAQTVLNCINDLKQPLLQKVELFDFYQGKGIDKDKKSLAFRLSYQAKDRTLTDDEIEQQVNAVFKVLSNEFSALRR